MDASDIRRALRLVAHEMNHAPSNWQRVSSREHLAFAVKAEDRALVGAAGGDHLTEAALALLFALELREREVHRR